MTETTALAAAALARAAAAANNNGGGERKPVVLSSTNPAVALSYLTIAGLWGASQVVLVPYVVHLLVLVGAILYAACHSSMVLREEPDPDDPLSGSEHSSSSSADRETLRAEDAYQFPIVGSFTLFGLYLLYRFFDKELINFLIGGYFALIGCFAVAMTVAPVVRRVSPKSFQRTMGWTYKLAHPLPEWIAGPSPWDLSQEFTGVDVVSLLVSAVVCALYLQNKTWYLNNVLGISFCLQGIERFSLGRYRNGAILLVGLFFYDIFWVFGTEVMVTVAKSLDGPIKILFPRTLIKDEETGRIETSLLGLGDIVIPGFFLAFLLRYDAHRADQPITYTDYHARFPKPFFHTTLVAYMMGLGCTLFVMIRFNAAQPALLYLVPACLGSSFLLALLRGEVKELLAYSEEQPEEEEEEEEEDEKATSEEKESESKKDD